MKKYFLLTLSLSLLLAGCTPAPEGDSGTDTIETESVTLTFLNGGFTGSLDETKTLDNFTTWCKTKVDFISTIEETGYVQLNNVNDLTTMIIGSAKSEGSLTFNFTKDVVSVALNVQAYTKYIDYNSSYSTDLESKFYVDDVLLEDLSISEAGETEKKGVEKKFDNPKKSFSISNKDGRVFFHSMTISYIN